MTDYRGIEVTNEQFARADAEWLEYWKAYCIDFPDADGSDYADEKEAFFGGKFGGNFKHI